VYVVDADPVLSVTAVALLKVPPFPPSLKVRVTPELPVLAYGSLI
jgi:hypothetical protein